MLTINVVCAVALTGAVLAALFPGVRRGMRVPAVMLGVSTLIWVLGAQLRSLSETESATALSILGVGVAGTAGAGYLLVQRLIDVDSKQRPLLIAGLVVMPLFIGVAGWNQWTFPNVDDFRASPGFMLHAAYTFSMLALMLVTLSKRQHDPSARVRRYIRIIQALLLVIVVFEVAVLPYTHIVVTVVVVVATYIARKPEIWWSAPTDADDLLNAIGVFLFVFDDEGRLLKWNTAASRLVEAIRPGMQLRRGAFLESVLESPSVLSDGAILEFDVGGGVLRTICHTHDIESPDDPDSPENVIMLRPMKSPIRSSAFGAPSGVLDGYDPATQTLSRRTILDRISEGDVAVKIELQPNNDTVLVDEAVFVVARRLEAAFRDASWGRIDDWSLAAATTSSHVKELVRSLEDRRTPPLNDGLAVSFGVYVEVRDVDENGESFAARVAKPRMQPVTKGATESRL